MNSAWRWIAVLAVLVAAGGPWLFKSRPQEKRVTVAVPATPAPPVHPLAQARATAFAPGPVEARIAALRVLVALRDVESTRPIIGLLGSSKTPAPLRAALITALGDLGPGTLPVMNEMVIAGEHASELAEQAVAEACVRIGRPAVPVLVAEVLRWKLFPDPDELQLYLRALVAIGDPAALPALQRALAQDILGLAALIPNATPEAGIMVGPAGPGPTREPIAPIMPREPRGNTVPADGVVRVRLEQALVPPGQEAARKREPLTIEFVRRDGRWEDTCWGYSLNYNKREHPGRVTAHTDEPLALTVQMALRDDIWVKGGFGEFVIELAPDFTGRYHGHFNHRAVTNSVTAVSWPLTWPTNNVTLAVDEHPRLIFRQNDIAALRAKARTPFGRRVISLLRDRLARDKTLFAAPVDGVKNWRPGMDLAIGHGFLSLLFDDPAHGQRAAKLVADRAEVEPYWGEHGECLPAPAFLFPFAYDLAHHALTAAERREVEPALESICGLMPQLHGLTGVFAGGQPPGMYGVPGLMALCLLRQPQQFNLYTPIEPFPFRALPAGQADGLPVNRLESDTLIRAWAVNGQTPLPPAAVQTMKVFDSEIGHLVMPEGERFLHCAVPVDTPQGWRINPQFPAGRRWANLWINGAKIETATVVELAPGTHHLIVEAAGPRVYPQFAAADALTARALRERYDFEMDLWRVAKKKHDQDGESARLAFLTDACARGMRLWLWQRPQHASDLQWPFVAALWTATGKGCYPDTPLPAMGGLSDRALAFMLGVAPLEERRKLAREFDRRDLSRMGCLELVAAFVNYPVE